jgi:anti-sigma B factor antagonist
VLGIDVEPREGGVVVHLDGEIDMRTAPDLRERLNALVDDLEGAGRLVLDVSNVPFIDSTALSVFVGVHKRLRRRGHGLSLACPSVSVTRVLDVTGLGRVFEVHGTLDDALA